VLYKDPNTGAPDIEATQPIQRPVRNSVDTSRGSIQRRGAREKKQQDAAIYKSTDEGSTWSAVEGKGLPTDPMGRMGVAVAPGTNGMQVYAIVAQGLFSLG